MTLFKNIFGNSKESTDSNVPKANFDWKMLTDMHQLEEITTLSHETPIMIFKHSTRCGISKMVLKQFENEFTRDTKVTPYFLDLLAHRDISNAISERFNVRHQSPQLLLIRDGKSAYDASHSEIDAGRLKSKL